jgi:hypothetical protein
LGRARTAAVRLGAVTGGEFPSSAEAMVCASARRCSMDLGIEFDGSTEWVSWADGFFGEARMVKFDENGKISIEALCKGETLSEDIVSRILDCDLGTDEFRTGVVYLAERIQARLWELGRTWLVVAERGELRILTDGETATYLSDKLLSSLKSLLFCYEAMRGVDTSEFDAEERVVHEEELESQALILEATVHLIKRVADAGLLPATIRRARSADSYDGSDGWK